ncbi:MAG: hypothetical protein A2X82_01865 [Geobacteraceae bacterium GWC2_55_20]|nr:MAG: hypothetical protein A2X82_01865 [Geobacteraceae bacterium GWC2_55_20]OGU24809.1 MAG: hypothetical protein A2X85_08715 [Geobacteraceae bacterium GWF2_54_21]HCE68537.1 nucleotidyltransferase [Geobacter sp.]
MSREWALFFQDIIDCCAKILNFTSGMTREQFEADALHYDATVWNVSLIGEAAKNIPEEVQKQLPAIPWRKLIGMRNKLSHGYFGVDNDILWNVIQDEIPKLVHEMQRIQRECPQLFHSDSPS